MSTLLPDVLEVRLQQRLGDFELQAQFEVRPGERVGISAPSGSGKTSLLRWIAGISTAPAIDGSVKLGGRRLDLLPPERREIGMVFQESALFPALRVWENAAFGLAVRGVPVGERKQRALEWLGQVGLGARAMDEVTHLSGGERQRLAWVRALIWKPRLLLLDEPFAALDSSLKESLMGILRELHASWPVPLLWVTHDREEISQLATRTLRFTEDSSARVRRFY